MKPQAFETILERRTRRRMKRQQEKAMRFAERYSRPSFLGGTVWGSGGFEPYEPYEPRPMNLAEAETRIASLQAPNPCTDCSIHGHLSKITSLVLQYMTLELACEFMSQYRSIVCPLGKEERGLK